jgi:hypothetical protein
MVIIPALVTVSLACAPSAVESSSDPVEECYRENFPLALALPQGGVPKEVRFYCAAPWDMNTMHSVRRAMDEAKFDLLNATIRLSSSTPDAAGAKMAAKAIDAADKGPPSTLGTMYRIHFALPIMYALHFQTSDSVFIKSRMHPIDLEALTKAAKSVDWSRPALQAGKPLSKSSRLKPEATLSDVATYIVQPGSK